MSGKLANKAGRQQLRRGAGSHWSRSSHLSRARSLLAVLACTALPVACTPTPTGTDEALVPSQTSTTAPTTTTSTTTSTTQPTTTIPLNPDLVCTPAPSDTTEIIIDPPWEPGAIRSLEVTRSDLDPHIWNQGRSESVVVADVKLSIGAGPESGLLFNWSPQSVTVAPVGLSLSDFNNNVTAFWGRANLTYQLDSDSDRLRVTNLDDARTSVRTSLLAEAADADADDQEWLGLTAALVPYLRDHDIQQLSIPAVLLHDSESVHVQVGSTSVVDTHLTMPIGERRLPARSSQSVSELIGDDGCVIVEVITILHPQNGPAAAQLLFNSAFGPGVIELDSSTTLTIKRETIYHYDYTTGFVKSFTSETSTVVDRTEEFRSLTVVDTTGQS